MRTSGDPGGRSAEPPILALPSISALSAGLFPDVCQEVELVILVWLIGLGVAVFAVIRGISAVRAKRRHNQVPWVASPAVGISALPYLVLILLVTGSSASQWIVGADETAASARHSAVQSFRTTHLAQASSEGS